MGFEPLAWEFIWSAAMHGVAILKLQYGSSDTQSPCKSEGISIKTRYTDKNTHLKLVT